MTRRIVEVDGSTYVFSPDDKMSLGERIWALVRGRAVDELTNRPPANEISLESDITLTSPRVVGDGIVGLVGIPRHVFPTLAMQNYSVHLTLQAEGYIPYRADIIIPNDQRLISMPISSPTNVITLNNVSRLSEGETLLVGTPGVNMEIVKITLLGPGANQVTFKPELSLLHAINEPVVPVVPNDFAPADIGDLFIHREPVVILGRTVLATGNTTTPISGATVAITGVWRTFPPVNVIVPADPPNIVSLLPSLYFARTAATGRLRRREMTPVVGEDKRLIEETYEGSNRLRLSDRVNLFPAQIILIDSVNPELMEYMTINTISGASSADQPATITLTYPVAHSHRRDAVVRRVIPQPPGLDNQFAQDAIVGDTCVFLNSMNDLIATNVVEIFGGGPLAEYHALSRFSVSSNAEGYFRLPPLSRVAQLEIQADDSGAHPTINQIFSPNYTQRENRIDFVFR